MYVVSVLHYSKWQLNAVDDTITEALDLAVIEVYCRPIMWAMRAAKSSCLKFLHPGHLHDTVVPSARRAGMFSISEPERRRGRRKNDEFALLVVERWSTKVAEGLAHAYLL